MSEQMVKVMHFKSRDGTSEASPISRRMASRATIKRICCDAIEGTEIEISESLLDRAGFTPIDFSGME
jgi:hypothetical protein